VKHGQLVRRAARWLANTKRCSVVITEMAGGGEEPDAIGWSSGYHAPTVLVECKASRSDFDADRLKVGRRRVESLGKGNERYYLVPPDLLDYALQNAPEKWGVLVAHKNRVEVRRESGHFESARGHEMAMLVSVIRRIAGRKEPLEGVNVSCYTIGGDRPRATLGVLPYKEETTNDLHKRLDAEHTRALLKDCSADYTTWLEERIAEFMMTQEWHRWPEEKPPEDGPYMIHAPSADPQKPMISLAWYNPAKDEWSALPKTWTSAIDAWMFIPPPPEWDGHTSIASKGSTRLPSGSKNAEIFMDGEMRDVDQARDVPADN